RAGGACGFGNCGYDWDGIPATIELPTDLIPAACRPASPRLFAAGSPNVCLSYVGGCSGTTRFGYTGTNGDTLEGWNGLGSFTTTENTSALLRWVNQSESTNAADLAARTSGDYCNHTMAGPGHDCELRALGGTPLASLLTAADSYANPIKTADTLSSCRPYSVIL